MATSFEYPIPPNFASGVNLAQLRTELVAPESGVSVQVLTLSRIGTGTEDDKVTIVFKVDLSSEEETALQALVAGHVPAGSPTEQSGLPVRFSDDTPTSPDDKRLLVSGQSYPRNLIGQFLGRGDDVASGVRNAGDYFAAKLTEADSDLVIETQWVDEVYLWGGNLDVFEGEEGDTVVYRAIAPATPVTPGGAQNCVLVDAGGFNMIVPMAPGTGTHEVDVASGLNVNLGSKAMGTPKKVTAAVPVPAYTYQYPGVVKIPLGYWNYDAVTGEITDALPVGPEDPPTGFYNLYDAEIPVFTWINGWSLDCHGVGHRKDLDVVVPSDAAQILPHWKLRATFHKELAGDLRMNWLLFGARAYSG